MIFMDELIIDMTWFQVESLKLKVMEIRDSKLEIQMAGFLGVITRLRNPL